MILDILKAPNPKLKKKAQNINIFDEKIYNLSQNMVDTMKKYNGCGLASIQVNNDPNFKELNENHEYRAQPNMFVAIFENQEIVIINPKILEYSQEKSIDLEGCLSIPYQEAKISRPKSIKVQYQNLKGETIEKIFKNINARIFQHEFDHNQGILYPNRINNKLEELLFWKNYNS